MVSRGPSDKELPPGWKEHVKVTNGRKIKFYTHSKSGLRLYSKKRVWSVDQMQASEGTLRPLGEQDQEGTASKSEDKMLGCQGILHSLSEQNLKSITTRSGDKVQAFQGTLQSSSEQKQMISNPNGTTSKSEDKMLACQGTLHSLSKQNQKNISTRSGVKVQASQGTLQSSSEQKQMISTPNGTTSKSEDKMLACQGTLHSLSEQNQKSITTRSGVKVQAFQGTLQSSSEQKHMISIPKGTTSKSEDKILACQGTLHSSSEQNQKSIITRSGDKVQAFQGMLQSSSDQKQMISTPKSEVDQVVVETNASLDWLPLGWIVQSKVRKVGSSAGSSYKIYIDPSTGCKFNSKPQVMRYLERVNGKSTPEKQNEKQEVSVGESYKQETPQIIPIEDKTAICVKDDSQADKMSLEVSVDKSHKQEAPQSIPVEEKTAICVKDGGQACKMSSVVSRITGLSELPPGWVKELRARKSDPNKVDPYYIDPDSGYEFRSKKDVLRYLETGNMSSCAMKPHLRRRVEKSITTPTRTACKNLDLNVIEDQGAVSSSASATLLEWKQLEAEESKETKPGCIFAAPKVTFGYNDEKKLHPEKSSESNIKGTKSSVEVTDTGATSGARTRTRSQFLHEQKHQEDQLETETQRELKKSLKRKPLSMPPPRSSKRLSGVEPEVLPVSSERAIRAAVKKAIQEQGHVSSVMEKGFPHHIGTTNQSKVLSTDPLVTCKVASPSSIVENGFPQQLGTSTHQPKKLFEEPPVTCKVASPSLVLENSFPHQLGTTTNKAHPLFTDPLVTCKVASQEAAVLNSIEKLLPSHDLPKQSAMQVQEVQERPAQAARQIQEVQERPRQTARQIQEVQERPEQEARKAQEVLQMSKQAVGQIQEVQEKPEQGARQVHNFQERLGQASEQVQERREVENPGSQVSHSWYPFGDSLSDPCYEVQKKPEQGAGQVHNFQERLGQASGQVQERREVENPSSQVSHSWYPFGDSLSDPCYEFAFKTLTGEIPFEDTLAFQNLFQQPAEAPSTQSVVSMGLPAIGTPSLFQNDMPFQLDLVHNKVPTDQLPNNSTLQPANINQASFVGLTDSSPAWKQARTVKPGYY